VASGVAARAAEDDRRIGPLSTPCRKGPTPPDTEVASVSYSATSPRPMSPNHPAGPHGPKGSIAIRGLDVLHLLDAALRSGRIVVTIDVAVLPAGTPSSSHRVAPPAEGPLGTAATGSGATHPSHNTQGNTESTTATAIASANLALPSPTFRTAVDTVEYIRLTDDRPRMVRDWAPLLEGISARELDRAVKRGVLAHQSRAHSRGHRGKLVQATDLLRYLRQRDAVVQGQEPAPEWFDAVVQGGW